MPERSKKQCINIVAEVAHLSKYCETFKKQRPKVGTGAFLKTKDLLQPLRSSRESCYPFENPGAPGASGATVAPKSGDPFHKKKSREFPIRQFAPSFALF